MKGTQHTFKRYEKKYLLTPEQYGRILPELGREMREDEYGQYTICNIYYDTQSFELVRASMAKPVYKEKFRLRSYGVPDREGVIYAEIKKKYDGVVCKRRVAACPDDIQAFITEGRRLDEDREIQQEIRCFFDRYHPQPKVFIGYDRMALAGREEPELRITFDRNIRWRGDALDLCAGDRGKPVLPDGGIVMEVKVLQAAPLWLAHVLSENRIYPVSFSKYGTCYRRHIAARQFQKG